MNEEAIKQQLRAFAAVRDWEQFHSPKNLAMALSVEVAELLEHFQWMTEAQSRAPEPETLAAIRDEVADVQIYLLRLADQLGIDIASAVQAKIVRNDQKYPADRVRGRALKYTAYAAADQPPADAPVMHSERTDRQRSTDSPDHGHDDGSTRGQ